MNEPGYVPPIRELPLPIPVESKINFTSKVQDTR